MAIKSQIFILNCIQQNEHLYFKIKIVVVIPIDCECLKYYQNEHISRVSRGIARNLRYPHVETLPNIC